MIEISQLTTKESNPIPKSPVLASAVVVTTPETVAPTSETVKQDIVEGKITHSSQPETNKDGNQ